jgi:hypothetical protein
MVEVDAATPLVGEREPHRWPSHSPVASPEGRAF